MVAVKSGAPFTVTSSLGNSLRGSGSDRGDLVAGVPLNIAQGNRTQWINVGYFNPAAFTNPAIGGPGTVGRNTIRGPGLANSDLNVAKLIPLRERVRLQFRAEFFNLFNRVNLGQPLANVATASTFSKINSARDPRILQFGLKLMF